MKVVAADALREMVRPRDLIDPMRAAFLAISEARVRSTFGLLELDDGDVHVKAASEAGGPLYVVKLASWVASNASRGLPAGSGALVVCSQRTGAPLALLVDEHYLTDARTAAAGALATDMLARPKARSVAVLGAGTQAREQVLALAGLRGLERVVLWARRRPAADALASELARRLAEARVSVEDAPADAVRASDIVITTTASRDPLLEAGWLRPGQHITALGADDDDKRELTSACFARADVIAVDSRAQTCATAELREALTERVVAREEIVELGEVLKSRHPGRTNNEQVTIAKLTGVAPQDLAIASVLGDRLGLVP